MKARKVKAGIFNDYIKGDIAFEIRERRFLTTTLLRK